ncbi:putative wsc domain-containing protein [Phaeoacremonium minimum UCRPA7]|uniref:Putative wsc domain-containing protein n=1 Tax=Phaeoacremonium minimum (strain UCR-PA7) TaxID=1286976 RepID=R8BBJ5_PHAM7|nr:putative wsc domain-containing protein [Phaeoacremonium minimum UCRPA7]EON96671.1 putative wsc domain-containing protein [Phaeoacremonium minimum UCRPA7]
MNSKQTLTILITALLGVEVSAFWRMECRGRSGLARIDPLVDKSLPAQHLHAIHGSSGFNEAVTYEELVGADCTSCGVTQDKSAYWVPPLFFHDNATGEYSIVNQVGGILAYYFLNKDPAGDSITGFPKDFRMIAGTSSRRNYTAGDGNYATPDPEKSLWASLGQTDQGTLSQRALGFNCLDYSKTPEGSLYRHFLPDKGYLDANCPDGIRTELMFPSCWNGKDTDSSDHKSHVAYPDLVIQGNCPSGFPTRLPGLFYEVIWDTYAFKDQAGYFTFANGDPLGFGYHGDFIMGWDEAFLQEAVDTCTNESGRIEDCPIFTIQDENTQRQCSIAVPGNLKLEVSFTSLTSLPGNVPDNWGPAPATVMNPTTPATVVVPTLTYAAGETAAVNGSYIPGQIFFASTQTSGPAAVGVSSPTDDVVHVEAVPAADATPTPAPTTPAPSPPETTPAPAPADTDTRIPISTGYVTDGNMVTEILYYQDEVYVTEYEDITTTVTVSAAVKKRRDSRGHLHRHRHLHGRPW